MSTLQEIQAAITELSSSEREALLSWLLEADRKVWDEEISRDFSEGGAGMKLLGDVDEQLRCGNFDPLE
jgi:hypothetical protein